MRRGHHWIVAGGADVPPPTPAVAAKDISRRGVDEPRRPCGFPPDAKGGPPVPGGAGTVRSEVAYAAQGFWHIGSPRRQFGSTASWDLPVRTAVMLRYVEQGFRDCPPGRQESALPFPRNRSTAGGNGQAKNRWQEPLVPRQDGAGRSTQRRAMPRWFGGKRPFRFPRVAKEALAGYSAGNGGLHVNRCPVGGSWTITALAARIRTA
jgi:hypothetical protein